MTDDQGGHRNHLLVVQQFYGTQAPTTSRTDEVRPIEWSSQVPLVRQTTQAVQLGVLGRRQQTRQRRWLVIRTDSRQEHTTMTILAVTSLFLIIVAVIVVFLVHG